MKKIILVLGWLTIPGFMNLMCIHELHTRAVSRPRTQITVGLSVIAALIYGSVAIYFGDPGFRNTGKEILSPLFALVWLPNFVVAILGTLALFVTKGEIKT